MDNKLTLNTKTILEKQFTKNVKGYDPEEVDDFLDLVLSDYRVYDSKVRELSNYAIKLEADIKQLKDSMKNLETENYKYKERFKGIKPGDKISPENMEYIQRIRVLENKLHSLGVDPRFIK